MHHKLLYSWRREKTFGPFRDLEVQQMSELDFENQNISEISSKFLMMKNQVFCACYYYYYWKFEIIFHNLD